ncbi:DoxX family membrane protein [Dyella sp. 2HG41-7]|uniref:DoxX family membrane protein n=1 Tax=Dyella sp. 2HG41-7 TaxID=2883239 RepID=UPI001F1C542A|nr:DoxX family membrane protein [Dyella sp. 2HG41-7]
MLIAGAGRVVFALAFVVLGLLSIFSGDFALLWQPVPPDVPARAVLAVISGVIMFAGGVGMLIPRTRVPASFVMAIYTAMWLLLLHVPHVIVAPSQEVNWGACGEIVTLVAACWVLYAQSATPNDKPYIAALTGPKAIRIARLAFGVAVPLVGLEHLIYVKETAAMVPAWLPDHTGWAYFTGIAHIVAGLAIAFDLLPRLAATLEALMMGGFTVFVWIPMVMAAPSQRFTWTGIMISTVFTAAGWVIASSYRQTPWLSFNRSRNRTVALATH